MKLSVTVLGPGDEQAVHKPEDEEQEEVGVLQVTSKRKRIPE